MAEHTISVIIPVCNGERYLGEALESVFGQTRRPDEVVVVDDGSTDGSAQVVKGLGDAVHYVYQENQGVGAASNTGIQRATGSMLAFIAADDLWTEHKLALQEQAMAAHPDVDMVFGHVEQFHSPDLHANARASIYCPPTPEAGYHQGCLLIKTASLHRVGHFETRYVMGEFIEWYGRAMEQGLKSIMLDEVVYRRRLHGTNLSLRKKDSRTDYAHVLKAAIDRKRRRGEA